MLATVKGTNPKNLRCRNATRIANNHAFLIETLTTPIIQRTSYCHSLKQRSHCNSSSQSNHDKNDNSLSIYGCEQKNSIPSFDEYGKRYNVRFFSKKSSAASFLSLAKSKMDTDPSQVRQQYTKHMTIANVPYNYQTRPDAKPRVRNQYVYLNNKIVSATSCNEILSLIEHSLDKNAGGRILDHICFATIVSHLAHHLPRNIMERNIILRDKRFSQFFACLAEALVSTNSIQAQLQHYNNNGIQFGSRDTASIGWAIAKLGIVVPSSKLPMMKTSMQSGYNDEASQTLSATAQRLRYSISINSTKLNGKRHTIIPYNSELPTLISHILDYVGIVVSTSVNANMYTTLTIRDCANLYWAWAAAGRADTKVFELVAVLMNKRIHELLKTGSIDTLNPQDISNLLWAMATADVYAGIHQVTCIELVTRRMQSDNVFLRKFSPQALSNTAWAISKLASEQKIISIQSSSYPLASVLIQRMQQSADTINRIVATGVLQQNATGFTAQELSNTALAFSKVDSTDIRLIRKATQLIMVKSLQILPQFKCQEAGSLVMAVATLFESNSNSIDNLFHRVGNLLLDRNLQVRQQSIYMTLLAFGKIKFPDRNLYRKLVSRFNTSNTSSCSADTISKIVYSLAMAGGINVQNKSHPIMTMTSQPNSKTDSHSAVSVDPVLHCCAIVANEFMQRSHEFSTQDISKLCWSFATLKIKDATFLTKVEQEIKSRISNTRQGMSDEMIVFGGQAVASLFWSFAVLKGDDSNLLQYFEPYILKMCMDETCQNIRIENIAKVFGRQKLRNIAWACAVFGKFPEELMKMLYRGQFGSGALEDIHHLSKIYGDGGFNFQVATALVHVQIAMGLADSKNGLSLPRNFPEAWMQVDGSSTSEMSPIGWEINTSRLQKDVSNSLKSVGFDHVEEYTISMKDLADEYCIDVPRKDIPLFSMDIANLEEKIAIEVDGPRHYLLRLDNDSLLRRLKNGQTFDESSESIIYEVTGSTKLKQRLLASMGWKVLTVPFWEWDIMQGNEQKQKEYCVDLLQQLQEKNRFVENRSK